MVVQVTQRLTAHVARFPNDIRTYRLRAGLTQRRLGGLVGHRRSEISAWERGEHLPTIPNLFRLARALDTLGEALYWRLYAAHRSHDERHGAAR